MSQALIARSFKVHAWLEQEIKITTLQTNNPNHKKGRAITLRDSKMVVTPNKTKAIKVNT